ncbi:MAG: type II toxin-antitoxin system Phd/YefM family antitoxin [Oscillospiraceae bacterium]|jgi:prevent-host-death family protein|nr:type II toxin-antitoxin system Phd/YefM family antitoxin [Oscillospiraceae bacterium]
MTIRPSTALRNEYNDISAFCKENGQPVFLTKNGEGDLVVMSLAAYARREAMLDLREKLLDAEAQVQNGARLYSTEEVSARLLERIHGQV